MRPVLNRIGFAAAATLLLIGAAACSDKTVAPPDPTGAATTAATNAANATPHATVETQVRKTTELSVSDLVRRAEPSIVRVQSGSGVGTGFVFHEDGYIVTNNHVVQVRGGGAARVVNVTLSDGTTLSATVVGTDARTDVAVLKVESPTRLKALPFAKLDEIEIGQDVVAIGYALDLRGGEGPSFTVTRGIVSQKNRAISEGSPIVGAIQTDAAINHGNSGGPLLTLTGEVAGINTAIAPDPSTGDVAPGIGFAMGSDLVKAVAEEIRLSGKVDRGFLGISNFTALRPAKARELRIPEGQGGVLLGAADSVPAGGPADAAGIRAGDVIVSIDGVPIRTESDLVLALVRSAPGRDVTIQFYRDGQKMTVQATLAAPSP
jgi:S1-C subfamily serine protease